MTIFFLSFSIFKVLSEKILQSNQDTAVTKFQNDIPYIKYKNKCYKKKSTVNLRVYNSSHSNNQNHI